MKDFTYIMQGMDCPHCAALIEGVIKKMPDCITASCNLLSQELHASFSADKDEQQIFAELQKTVNYFEPEVILHRKTAAKPQSEENKFNKTLLQIIISGILFAAGFILHLAGIAESISIILFLASFAIAGYEVLFTAIRNLTRGRVFDENLLMSIASVGAIAISSYEEAAAVMLFYMVGEYFQDMAVDRSRRSINALIDSRPEYVTLYTGNIEHKVPAAGVGIGSRLLIKPGEKIALDGIITEGCSAIDTRSVTGEPLPQDVMPGNAVYAGCINISGAIIIETIKAYNDSLLANICRMIEGAGANKAPAESFISRFARVYTPIVVGAAALLAVIPPLLGFGVFTDWLYRALVFLVVSCPCALVISVPLSFFAGIGGAGRQGILIKGGNYLSAIAKCRTIAFDKTGTLTSGEFKIEEIVSAGTYSEQELLRLAAYAESRSTHPIAASVLNAYDQPIEADTISNLQELPGLGIAAQISNKNLLIGNSRLLESKNIKAPITATGALLIAIDGHYAGHIIIADEIKAETAACIAELRKQGIKTVMLTGDSRYNADKYAAKIGIDEYHAELLPADKVTKLESLKNKSAGTLLFVGDGINDAPALKLADTGIAMGAIGSDAAIEAADAVIMNDDMSRLPLLHKIAVKTETIVKQNIIFALGVKILILIAAASGSVGMWAAVFADVGVAIIAILNAARAGNIK